MPQGRALGPVRMPARLTFPIPIRMYLQASSFTSNSLLHATPGTAIARNQQQLLPTVPGTWGTLANQLLLVSSSLAASSAELPAADSCSKGNKSNKLQSISAAPNVTVHSPPRENPEQRQACKNNVQSTLRNSSAVAVLMLIMCCLPDV